MLSFSDLTAAPLDLELARSADTAAQVDHLFVFRDTGALSIRGSARSSTDLFSLSVAGGGGRTRMSSFCGIVVGMRLSVRPERLPGTEALEPLVSTSVRVRQSDDGVPSLVAALDGLARALSLAAPPQAFSDRTGRRRARAETRVSRRRFAAIRRFCLRLGRFSGPALPWSDLALDAGYYDQSHMSASCRAFADRPPGALRFQATARAFGLS